MKKLLLLFAGCFFAGSTAFAQDQTEGNENWPIGPETNYVLTVQAMDAATEYGDEKPSVSYFLQPLSENSVKYSTLGLDENIVLKGYTDPVKNKTAKYIYSVKYYKAGYKTATEDQNGDAPVGNADNSYTVFISGEEPDINLSVCATWPDGKTYVEWIHNFSNIVATDANVYGYIFIEGNELPETYTYLNKFAKTDDFGGTLFNKFYTKTDTNASNISTNFLKGNSQSSLVYLNSESSVYNNETESGVFKITLDYATGELSLIPCTEKFELFIDGFTTFSAPFSYSLPEGTKAFTLTYDAETATLKAEPIDGNSIEANTPVVIKASTPGEYHFAITSEPSFTPVTEPTQAKKAYIPDTKMEGNVLVGVNHPHWIDVYNGTQTFNYRYTRSGNTFAINKAFSSKKNYDNTITPQYTCYVELPSDVENAPQNLEVVFMEEEEVTPEISYYLANSMTANDGGAFTPNDSYKFQAGDDENTYTLTVGSVSSSVEFYVLQVKDGVSTTYSADGYTEMIPVESVAVLEADNDSEMTLDNNYVNVTFTLTLSSDGAPYKLSYNGTVNGDAWNISAGNDQTMQSGTVNGNTIEMASATNGALVYIYVPSANADGDVYYSITEEAIENEGLSLFAEEEPSLTKAVLQTEDGSTYFTVPVKKGYQGEIKVYTSDDSSAEPAATFNYSVSPTAIPTGVETVTIEEESVIYNLFGQRVDESYRGIVIKNGKKYIQR